MKTLMLIRHAKTESGNFEQDDFSRVLTEQGKKDAQKISKILDQKGFYPEKIFSSPAARTRETSLIFAKNLSLPEENIVWEDAFYQAYPEVFKELIYSLDNAINSIALVAHNPGISQLAYQLLSPTFDIDLVPCGTVIIQLKTPNWTELRSANKQLLFSMFP